MSYLKAIIPIIIVIIIGIAIVFNSGQENIEEEIVEKKQWITSGPFSIEKHQYYLGEKIFLTVSGIPISVSGEAVFFRPSEKLIPQEFENMEGVTKDMLQTKEKYLGIQFDGKSKENFNRYFEPRFNEFKNICSTSDLVGIWAIVFQGTDYEPIYFEILNQTASWDDRTFEPIC